MTINEAMQKLKINFIRELMKILKELKIALLMFKQRMHSIS